MDQQQLVERQQMLETEMAGLGAAKYQDNITRNRMDKRESVSDYGQTIISQALGPVSEAITAFVKEANTGKPGRRHVAVKYLRNVNPDVAAFLTIRHIIDSVSSGQMLQTVCVAIGLALEDEERFSVFQKQHPGMFSRVLDDLNRRTSNPAFKRSVMVNTMNQKVQVDWEPWSKQDKLHIGQKLIDIFIQTTGMVKLTHRRDTKNRTKIFLTPTEDTVDLITQLQDRSELMSASYMPTVIPPADWTTPYQGGYHFTPYRQPLIKSVSQNFLEELRNNGDQMKDVYRAINLIQGTAWKINQPVLDVVRAVWDGDMRRAKAPRRDPEELPETPEDIDTNEEAKKAWKRQAASVHRRNAKLVAKRFQFTRILALAEKFADDEAIYFPHQMDFRGRLYPLPMYLQPQGNDLAKGMLTFSQGKPIETPRQLGWLMIHGANTYGYDKCSLEERVQWVADHEDQIIECAEDPFGTTFWSDAGDPWCFLAFCFEYHGFCKEGYGFVSHLPVAQDGSCNGLQHFAAMMRSEEGQYVNLVPNDKPADIYQRVADRVKGMLAESEDPMAQQWLDYGITRKDTKRGVMVVPYSGTLFAVRKYVEERLEERNEEGDYHPFGDETFAASKLLAGLIWAAINETVHAARAAMDWLQDASRKVSELGLPITWTTPDGLPVMQAYANIERYRVKTQMGDSIVKMFLVRDGKDLSKSKQASGIAPNFVHSMDACALRMYVNLAADNDITSFACVHDSYGVLAADTDVSNACLRHAFVDMYLEHDVLNDLKVDLESLLQAPLPDLPSKGNLDIEAVRDAEYFFA